MHRMLLTLALLLALAVPAAATEFLTVGVSIPPQAWFLKRLGGEHVRPVVMLPPGRSPATYEPTPKQLAALGSARLYFRIGVPFEGSFLPRLRRNLPQLSIVDTRQGIKLLPLAVGDADHGPGARDPHIWLSPPLAKVIAATMAQALGRADPAHAAAYAANLKSLQAELDRVDKKIAQVLAPYRGRTVLAFHPAYAYFCQAYGLRQQAMQTGGKEPGPRRLAQVLQEARGRGARVIFVQPQFSAASAQALARELGATVVPLDPLAPDYLRNLEQMATKLAAALAP